MALTFLFPFLLWLPAAGQPAQPNYCLAFLKTAPNRPVLSKEQAAPIQAAHLAHLTTLGKKGWLRAAGPMGKPGTIRGILISKCRSIEEADAVASEDPAVKAGLLVVESHAWLGPDGIADRYWKLHSADPSLKDRMERHALILVRKGTSQREMKPVKSAAHLAAGGPFLPAKDILGVLVYRNTSLEEASQLAAQEPAVPEGAAFEPLEWWVDANVLP